MSRSKDKGEEDDLPPGPVGKDGRFKRPKWASEEPMTKEQLEVRHSTKYLGTCSESDLCICVCVYVCVSHLPSAKINMIGTWMPLLQRYWQIP